MLNLTFKQQIDWIQLHYKEISFEESLIGTAGGCDDFNVGNGVVSYNSLRSHFNNYPVNTTATVYCYSLYKQTGSRSALCVLDFTWYPDSSCEPCRMFLINFIQSIIL